MSMTQRVVCASRSSGKERDAESGLDYFGARYNSGLMGRFMSPDDGSDQDPADPQSWNLYSYVQNNPLTNTDPDGHGCVTQTRTSETTEGVSVSSGGCTGAAGNGTTQTYVPGTVTGISVNGGLSGKAKSELGNLSSRAGEKVRDVIRSRGGSGSGLLATYNTQGVHFALSDWLGTKRVQASATGTVEETCLSLPFGDSLSCSGSDATEHHLTGKERDTESGLDFFGARYLGSSMGRFMSPDPSQLYYADITNPQSLNLYSYAQNNPLSNTDPTGLDCVYFNDAGNGVESVDRNSSSGECGSTGGDYVRGTIAPGGSGDFAGSNGSSPTFAFQSTDANGTYTTYANAPGSQSDGTGCSGNCTIANGFIPNYNGVPADVALNPFAQALFTEVGHQTAGLPNVCGVGITARFGVPGSRLSGGVDFNSQYGTRAAGGARIASLGGFQGSVSVKGKSVSASVSAPIPGTPFQGVVSTKGSEVSSVGVGVRAPFVNF